MFSRTIAVGFLFAVGSLVAGADPSVGTWKLNIGKSKFNPGPPPQSVTLIYEASGTGVKRSGETIDSTGAKTSWGYTAEYDGKDYTVTGNPNADMISLKKVNDRTVDATLKKGGKVVTHARRVVSADGKTLTLTIKGKNEKGQNVDNVHVYDKE